jgi:hypothetical protein
LVRKRNGSGQELTAPNERKRGGMLADGCVHREIAAKPPTPASPIVIASRLGRHGVSIKCMNQDTPGAGDLDTVIPTGAKVQAAPAEVDTHELSLRPTHRFRSLDGGQSRKAPINESTSRRST